MTEVIAMARLGALDVAALSAHADEQLVPRGTSLFAAGRVEHACVILDGAVRVTARGRTRVAGPREAVGVLELLADDPDGVDAVAESEVRLLVISRQALLAFLEDSAAAAFGTVRTLARRIIELARGGPTFSFPGAPRPRLSPARGPLGYADKLLCLHGALRHAPRRLAATAELARACGERRVRAGEELWRAGDASNTVAIIVTGDVDCEPRAGRSFRASAGDPLGGLEVLARVPRWHHATAATDLLLLELSHRDLLDILEDHVDLTIDIARAMAAILLRFERLA